MKKKQVTLFYALLPVVFLVVTLYYSVQVAKLDVHIPIFISAIFAAFVAKISGCATWNELEDGVVDYDKDVYESYINSNDNWNGYWKLDFIRSSSNNDLLWIKNNTSNYIFTSYCGYMFNSIYSYRKFVEYASTVGIALVGIGEGFQDFLDQ